jgi:broad specificity phosphatase PhoE
MQMPRRTELDRPSPRRRLAAKITLKSRASIRKRTARCGSTRIIFAGVSCEAKVSVLRNKLEAPTRASAFGRPNRDENPAASTTICGAGKEVAFIAIMLPMKKDHVSLQRQPFLAPIWLTAVAVIGAVVVLGFSAFTVWAWATAGSTTIVVIRHAEKDLSTGAVDPPLNEAGRARAELLARMFGDGKALGHLDAIYVTPALRNRLTAAPLAASLGLNPAVVPTDDPRGLARRVLHENGGGRVLIVGHSDTVPAIVSALSGIDKVPEIADEEYGTLYIVTVPRIGHANLLRLTY